jgi:hypothetical protein
VDHGWKKMEVQLQHDIWMDYEWLFSSKHGRTRTKNGFVMVATRLTQGDVI